MIIALALAVAVVCLFPARTAAASWYNAAWQYRVPITIHSTNVAGPLTNFTLLVNITNASVKASALGSGNDILFTSADGTNKLAHEIESYTSSDGVLVSWVKVPLLSSVTSTNVYLYYGNAAAANQQNATAVWDSSFRAVWHLKEDLAGTGTADVYLDSTANSNHGDDLVSSTGKTGKIGKGQSLTNWSDHIRAPYSSSLSFSGQITMSAWINYKTFIWDNDYAYIIGKGYDNSGEAYYLRTQRYPGGSPHSLSAGSYSITDNAATWTISGWTTGQWRHVVGVYDGSNWRVYMDGTQRSATPSATGALTNGMATLIGGMHNYSNPQRYSDALVDEVRISSTARSPSWITTEFRNQSAPSSFYSVGTQEIPSPPPTRIAITAVNSGTPPSAGTSFSVVVQAQDAGGNASAVTTNTAVSLTRATGSGTLTGTLTGTITSGNNSVTISGVNYLKAESGVSLTATRTSGMSLAAGTSSTFTVSPGPFNKLQLLMPGESAAPGTATGKSGSPTARTVASSFNITVNAVDANWNGISTNDTIAITSSDSSATLPANAALTNGTRVFSVTFNTAGSATVTATDARPGITSSTSPSTTVNRGSQTISFPSPGNQIYGANPALAATASSGLPITYSVASGPAQIVGTTLQINGAGSVSVLASQAGNTNWNAAATVTNTITVSAKQLTVTANNTNRLYGAPNPQFTASYSGFVAGENSSVLSGSPSLTTSAGAASTVAGSPYAITATNGTLSASNYTFVFVSGQLTINRASTTNALTTSANPAGAGSNVTFTAILNAIAPASGLPTGTVQFLTNNVAAGGAVAVSGGSAGMSTALLSRGSHTITARYSGDANFIGSTNSLIQSINTRPVAGIDTLPRHPLSGAKVRPATLLANDSDPDNDPFTLRSLSSATASAGTISSNANWIFYRPANGFTNADSFTYTIGDPGNLTATGQVSITIAQDLLPSQNLVGTDALGPGSKRLRFAGVPGRVYTIQYTTNAVLSGWQSLGTAIASTLGQFSFTNSAPPGTPARTYRSVQP
ncbi:MAG TPA: DUF2341 domain-containing protein [Verrucomicrobiae bacterium]|nr:DUF2341 domain-containing protein [Verrucomicrobiae bacterium]